MASWDREFRRIAAEQARTERESKKRQRELEKRRKAIEKAGELERARFEVEAYENEIELLLSIHRECRTPFDWPSLAAALPPHAPSRLARREITAVFHESLGDTGATAGASDRDAALHAEATAQHEQEIAEWARLRDLARRVLAGEPVAYTEAITTFAPFAEIDQLGTAMGFTVHGPRLVECTLTVNGQHVIPRHVKSLTSMGKLTAKAMPKARFHEIYQDYVCGSALRVGRELFALLPVETVLVTAAIDDTDPATGHPHELPVFSVCFHRDAFARLDFDRLDPSDSMGGFLHVGDVLASRRTGAFARIAPLTPALLGAHAAHASRPLESFLARACEMRESLAATATRWKLPSLPPAA
jgi:hypothetical protein